MWPRIVESPASAYFRLLVVKCQHSIDSERGIALQIYCSFSLRVLRLRPPVSALRAVPQFQPPAIGACCKSVNCGVKDQSAHRYVPKMRCCALWRPESCHFEGFRLPIRWVSRAVGLWQRANRELERDVAQRQRQGSQGPRGSKVATHCFGDPVGRAMDRFRHGCGERGARGNYCASGGSDGDIQAVLDAGIGRNGAGSTDRQNRRRRRWPT